MRGPELDRFLAKVDFHAPNGCWQWTAGTFTSGYGQFRAYGKSMRAHRFAYQVYIGQIPEGLVLDHLCRNKLCVNPDHLEAVTERTNILRGIAPPAINARRSVCVNGHALTPDNVYAPPKRPRTRLCRKCRTEEARRRRARLRLLAATTIVLALAVLLLPARAAHAATPSTREEWARHFLTALGTPVNSTTVSLIVGWEAAENVPPRLFNNLATTLETDDVVSIHNSHGVRGYRSEAAGIAATVQTVRHYPSTVAALAASDPDAFFAAPGWRRYCNCNTANYVRNIRAAYEAALPMSGPAPGSSTAATTPTVTASSSARVALPSRSSHGQDRTISPLVFVLAAACGAFGVVGVTRGARQQIAGASYALAASAAVGLLTMNVAGIDLARVTERGADAAYGWARDLRTVLPLGLLVCAAILATLTLMRREHARETLTVWALTVWRVADLTWAHRAWLYPIVGWAVLVAAGVKVGQTWAPWIIATIVAATSLVRRNRKAVA